MFLSKTQKIFSGYNYLLFLVAFSLVFLTLIIDIDNLDAIRQGTEGFYLQISKEMLDSGNWATPTYLGNPHWSKPPLHFWLPTVLYSVLPNSFILLARTTILLLSLTGVILIARWFSRNLNTIPAWACFIVFASSLGFIKYSRIFMMEMPLALSLTLSSLYFFEYIENENRFKFFLSTLFATAACLIKGPVAFVMVFPSAFIYLFFNQRTKPSLLLKRYVLWIALILILSSLWFIYSYLNHGMEFLEYFFIRENLGKFNAKEYPSRVLIEGLMLYSFPWSLFVPFCLYYFFIIRKQKYQKSFVFIILCFLFTFLPWFLPQQKSHHYAIPAIFFFLMIILNVILEAIKIESFRKYSRIIQYIYALPVIAIVSILALSLKFPEFNSQELFKLEVYAYIAMLIYCLYRLMLKKASISQLGLIFFFTIAPLWGIIMPSFTLPTVPQTAVDIVRNQSPANIGIIYRKPFFIQEALQRDVVTLDPANIVPFVVSKPGMYLVHKEVYEKNLVDITDIVQEWPVWKRGSGIKQIIDSIKNNDLSNLREYLVLLKSKAGNSL